MSKEEQMKRGDWIDISVPVYAGMVHWPDNPPIEIEYMLSMQHGANCNVSNISLGAHTGTHMDAPLHFIPGGKSIDQMPFTATLGRARVIQIHDTESIKTAELQEHHIEMGERILFKTQNSTRCWNTDDFVEDFVYISPEAAEYLARQAIQTVGVDYLSVGGYKHGGAETHQALLGAGIWIIEGLNLSQVQPGIYDLICLPLRLQGREGSPARAILRPLSE